MSDTGLPFVAGVGYVLSKMNRKTITMIDGDDLASQSPFPGQIYVILGDGGGLKKNDVVYRDADGLSWKYLTMQKHDHSADTNQAGGPITDVWSNSVYLTYVDILNMPKLEDFQIRENSGTGSGNTFDNTYAAIEIQSGTTNGGYANVKRAGSNFAYTLKSKLVENGRHVGNTTSFFTKQGINMESVNATNDNVAKFGKESCTATNGNWFITTADGSQRTQKDGEQAIQNDTQFQSEMVNNPGTSIDFKYASNTIVSKTTNLPNTGRVPSTGIYSAGVKSSASSAEKKYILQGLAIIAQRGSNSWF